MSENPFRSADAWEPSLDTLLPAGNHVVTIEEIAKGVSTNHYQQLELRLSNADGAIRDWLTITPQSAGKVVALANAAMIDLPEDTDIVDTATLELSEEYVKRFDGRTVGVVIREEPDYKDPSQTRLRVQGYVDPARIKEHSDVTSPGSAGAFKQNSSRKADEKIPF